MNQPIPTIKWLNRYTVRLMWINHEIQKLKHNEIIMPMKENSINVYEIITKQSNIKPLYLIEYTQNL